jgi:hypothetical protein
MGSKATSKMVPRAELTLEKNRLARAVEWLMELGQSQVEVERRLGIGKGTGSGALRRAKEAKAVAKPRPREL